MTKPKLVAAQPPAAAAPERSKSRISMEMKVLAVQATYEIESLAALLSRPGADQRADTFVYAARGIGRRIEELNGILMIALHDTELGEEDVRGCEREMYGNCNR